MSRLKRLAAAAASVALWAGAGPAAAVLVSAGNAVVFNFYGPPGPADEWMVDFGVVACSIWESAEVPCTGTLDIDRGTITIFDGLDATGSVLRRGGWNNAGWDAGFTLGPVLADGQFSIRYAATQGQIEVIAPYTELKLPGQSSRVRIDGELVSDIPEPGTLALLAAVCAAAAGSTLSRRRLRPLPRGVSE